MRRAYQASVTFFKAERTLGRMPPRLCLQEYTALVRPHLLNGATVFVVTSNDDVERLLRVEKDFLRRTLGVSWHTTTTILYTETGLYPLHLELLKAQLLYLCYALRVATSEPHLPLAHAIECQFQSSQERPNSWLNDLRTVLARHSVALPAREHITDAWVATLFKTLRRRQDSLFQAELFASRRTIILAHRPGPIVQLRPYLMLPQHSHRWSLFRLVIGEHWLASHTMSWEDRRVDGCYRLCRFCRSVLHIEDFAHVFATCHEPAVVEARQAMWSSLGRLREVQNFTRTALQSLSFLLGDDEAAPAWGRSLTPSVESLPRAQLFHALNSELACHHKCSILYRTAAATTAQSEPAPRQKDGRRLLPPAHRKTHPAQADLVRDRAEREKGRWCTSPTPAMKTATNGMLNLVRRGKSLPHCLPESSPRELRPALNNGTSSQHPTSLTCAHPAEGGVPRKATAAASPDLAGGRRCRVLITL